MTRRSDAATRENSNINTPAVYEPMKAYVRRALDHLRDICPQGSSVILSGLREWQRVADNAFGLQDVQEPFWVACVGQSASVRHTWPEYQALAAAIRADAVLGAQAERPVGTAFGAARQELEHIADALIWGLTARNGRFIFREAEFDEEFQRLVQRHEAAEVDVVVLGPLIGLKGDGFPIQFGEPALDIVEFTDSEIASCLRMGLIGPPMMADHRYIDRVVGLRVKFSVPKYVGEQLNNAPDAATS